jgi:hypothetical protein
VSAALHEARAVAEAQGATGFARQATAQLDGDMPSDCIDAIATVNIN